PTDTPVQPITPTHTDTPIPPTDTPVPPTDTPIPPTDTPVPPITPTHTPIPPTDTSVPPTDTPIPPTDTPVPPITPTHTDTPVPPTDTPIPPTETPTLTGTPPTNTPTDTPTGSVTPLPDLYVQQVRIELENGTNCNSGLGTSVWIHNQGSADAGPFDVMINSTTLSVASLDAGQTAYLWTSDYQYLSPETEVVVDVNNDVAESDESNNTFFALVPIPTLPAQCMWTDTPNPGILMASAACNGPDLDVNITSGDGPFDITASAGVNTPVLGVSVGTTTISGPEKWDNVMVAETSGDTESINLGQFKCRSGERPVPQSPAHRSRTTNKNPTFTWTGITNANNYRIFLFDDPNPATRTVDIRQNSGGPTQLTVATSLPVGRIFWRVRGRQNRVWSLWSIRFTLFVDP
ncbi:MAG: hypothetical protein L0154_19635, partial [Chloroflexi bacterium]|nr:hypothetical protein [Chloroflexota bacterium]